MHHGPNARTVMGVYHLPLSRNARRFRGHNNSPTTRSKTHPTLFLSTNHLRLVDLSPVVRYFVVYTPLMLDEFNFVFLGKVSFSKHLYSICLPSWQHGTELIRYVLNDVLQSAIYTLEDLGLLGCRV